MALPALRDGAVDKILSQFSIAYRNKEFISEMIMPGIKVKERSGKFAKYGKDNLRIEDNIARAPGTQARTFDYSVSQGDYACAEHALEKIVPDEFMNNFDDPYDPKRDATTFCVDKIWLNQENALATDMADTAIMTSNTTLSGTDQWSDYVNSDPLSDIRTGRSTVKLATGQIPNVAVFGWSTWLQFQNHPDVIDRIKYVGTTSLEAVKKAVADLLEVQTVLIGTAIKNTANQGQSDSLSAVWGKHFWLLVVAQRPSIMTLSFGYTLKDVDREVDTYRDNARKGDVVRVRDSFDQVLIDANLAYLIKNAVA